MRGLRTTLYIFPTCTDRTCSGEDVCKIVHDMNKENYKQLMLRLSETANRKTSLLLKHLIRSDNNDPLQNVTFHTMSQTNIIS